MKNNPIKYSRLDQYDFQDGEELEKKEAKYAPLIGLFILRFSELEHEIDVAIAEALFDDAHDVGYLVIAKEHTRFKIELFSRLYAVRAAWTNNSSAKTNLKELQRRLGQLINFRNEVVHASWLSLTKDGYVRTKITTDGDSGMVKFKNVLLTTTVLRDGIKETERLTRDLERFLEAH